VQYAWPWNGAAARRAPVLCLLGPHLFQLVACRLSLAPLAACNTKRNSHLNPKCLDCAKMAFSLLLPCIFFIGVNHQRSLFQLD
jgi:hypothetical protein